MSPADLLVTEVLTLRAPLLATEQVGLLLGLGASEALTLLQTLQDQGRVRRHELVARWPPPALSAPLLSWRPGEQPLEPDAVKAAVALGVRRWASIPSRVVTCWTARPRAARRTGGVKHMRPIY